MTSIVTNTAIITDMALIEAMAFIEDGVVTPSTLFAMNNLVQAVVLHDSVFLGMAGLVGAGYGQSCQVAELLGSEISGVPSVGQFHEDIDQEVYPQILHWVASERPIASLSVTAELDHLSVVLDYLRARKISDITDKDSLTQAFGVKKAFGTPSAVIANQQLFESFEAEIAKKGGTSISPNDLLALRDLAWSAAAGYTLSRILHFNIYHSLLERPFYASELTEPKGPLKLVSKAMEELSIENAYFDEIAVPPFLGLILSSRNFEPRFFWKMLLDARHKYRRLRKSVKEFHEAWHGAATVREQRDLLLIHNRAWKALLDKEEYLGRERILYVLVRALITTGKTAVTEAIQFSQLKQAIGSVGGLVKLWKDMQDIVPSKDGRRVLGKHFQNLTTAAHWKEINRRIACVNSAAALKKSAHEE